MSAKKAPPGCRWPEFHHLHRFGAGFRCLRCNHTWPPQKLDDKGEPVEPVTCPACCSPYHGRPKMTDVERSKFQSKLMTERARRKKEAVADGGRD